MLCIPQRYIITVHAYVPSNGICRGFALNTANSCCHHVFLRHFRFQKCLPVNNCFLYMIMISDILIQSDFLYVLYHNSRTRAIALYRPASHGCSFLNGARKEYVCFAAAFFSSALIISRFASSMLTAADAAIVIAIRRSP